MDRSGGGKDQAQGKAAASNGAGPAPARRRLASEPIQQLRTPRAAGVAGIIFAVLLVASFLLVRTPSDSLTDAETVAWFKDDVASNLTVTGLYLIPFAGIAFLWFIAVIRDRIGRFEDKFFSTIFLGTGLLFIAMVFAGEAVAGSLVAGHRFYGETVFPDADLIRSTRALSSTLIFVYGAKMAGVFVMVTNTIAFRVRLFSRWVALIGFVVALLLIFNVGFNVVLVTAFPAWVVFLSVYLMVTTPRLVAQAEDSAAVY